MDEPTATVIERAGARDLGTALDLGDGHPVTALAADDAEAAARTLREAFPETGHWPLILLDEATPSPPAPPTADDRERRLAEGWRREDLATGVEAVALAAGLSVDDAPYCGFFGGRPPTTGEAGEPPEVIARPEEAATLTGAWRRSYGLLLIPVENPWECLAHISFGSQNEGPADTGHVRFQRHLWERYGGTTVAVGHSRMKVELTRPPTDPAEAYDLANRLFSYCRDLDTTLADILYADLDEDDLDTLLAGVLLAAPVILPLWWD